MKRAIILSLAAAMAVLIVTGSAIAHSLWINLNESYAHPPGHTLVSLGWGHNVPLDDLLASPTGNILLESFDLFDPGLNCTPLPMPEIRRHEVLPGAGGLSVEKGELGICKLSLSDKVTPGTYQVAAVTKPTFFTMYIDENGKQKMATKPMDQIKGIKKVIASMKYQSFAKSYSAVKEWTEPKALGHMLELTPAGDLSDVHVGDVVPFKVTFNKKPVSSGGQGIFYITATSNTFGGPDGFFLSAYLMGGKAQFRMPTAGQWVVNVYIPQTVAPGAGLDDLVGKCTSVYYAGTIGFQVKP